MSKTTAVHLGPLYNIHKFAISSYQEILSSGIFKETLRECATFSKVANSTTGSSRVAYKKPWKLVQLILQVWSKTWSFYTQNLLLQTSLTRSLVDCQLILISLTDILIIGWLDPHDEEFWEEFQQESAPAKDLPARTIVNHKSRFANAEKRLFVTENYRFYIGTIWGLLGNHQIMCMDTKGPTDFPLDKQSLESNYNPHSYLLRGQGFLWYTAPMRAQIHTNVLYICSKIAYLSDCQELSQELKLDDDNFFTYEAYNQLLWNAAHEVRVSPIPQQTAKLVPSPSAKEWHKELLCSVWQTIAGPIFYYLDDPLWAYWFPQSDYFRSTALNFLQFLT